MKQSFFSALDLTGIDQISAVSTWLTLEVPCGDGDTVLLRIVGSYSVAGSITLSHLADVAYVSDS